MLAASLALHAAILVVLARPVEAVFPDRSDSEGAITVTLDPDRPRPAPEDFAAPPPTRPLTPRAPRSILPSPVPPLAVAPGRAGPSAPSRVPSLHPAPLPEGPKGDLRAALRGSAPGCANRDAVGLTRREREHCDERLGAGVRTARRFDAPIAPSKRRDFDRQALIQEAARAYDAAPMGPGVDHRSRDGPGKVKEIPFVLGAEQDGLGNPRDARSQRLKQIDDAAEAERRERKRRRE